VPLEFFYPASDEAAARVGEVLQQAWASLGVRLRLTPAEPKAAFAAVRRLEYDIAWGSWIADYPDPASFLEIFRGGSGNNRTGFSDPEYDALLDQAARERGSTRLETLRRSEARLLDLAPIAPLIRTNVTLLARGGVEGAVAVPLAHIFPWSRLRIRPEAAQ
jgi:ABC-type oligopeptide transport system substrate-binding subunit